MNKEIKITPKEIAKAIEDLLDENEKLKKQNTFSEVLELQQKIDKAIGYANERINYCYHNEIDATDWQEIFDILSGGKE